jgi:hypothetical protein
MDIKYETLLNFENVFKNKSFSITYKYGGRSWDAIFKGINHIGNNQARFKEKIPQYGYKENDGSICYIPVDAYDMNIIKLDKEENNIDKDGFMEIDLIHNLVNENTFKGIPVGSKGFTMNNKINKIEFNLIKNLIRITEINKKKSIFKLISNEEYGNQPE